jgi:hypothetical protein
MNLPINYDETHWTIRREAREQYIEEQDGLCWYCKTKLTGAPSEEVQKKFIDKSIFPEEMFNYPVHLHHDRTTGYTIGAVHAKCNAVLWQYHGE